MSREKIITIILLWATLLLFAAAQFSGMGSQLSGSSAFFSSTYQVVEIDNLDEALGLGRTILDAEEQITNLIEDNGVKVIEISPRLIEGSYEMNLQNVAYFEVETWERRNFNHFSQYSGIASEHLYVFFAFLYTFLFSLLLIFTQWKKKTYLIIAVISLIILVLTTLSIDFYLFFSLW